MNRLFLAGALPAFAVGLAGCNTIGGLGKDLQQAGGVIAGTAQGVQNGVTPAPQPPAEPPPLQTPATCQPDTNGILPVGCPAPQ